MVYLFADDAKLFKHILSESDEQQLQEGINELQVWTKNWSLNLNISKCKVISFGRTVDKSHTYNITDSDVILIDRVNVIKYLGIPIDEKLTFRDHIHDKINKAYMMLDLNKYLTVTYFTLVKEALIEIGCVVTSLVSWSLVVTRVHCGQTVHPRPMVTMEH